MVKMLSKMFLYTDDKWSQGVLYGPWDNVARSFRCHAIPAISLPVAHKALQKTGKFQNYTK